MGRRVGMVSQSWRVAQILSRVVAACPAIRGQHSGYIEALINGLRIGCLYLPNGNPAPGLKFEYKLRWLERLTKHAQELLATAEPVVLAGDYNVTTAGTRAHVGISRASPENAEDRRLCGGEGGFENPTKVDGGKKE